MIKENEIIWFVHLKYIPPLPLRFRRTKNFGAEIIGGKTRSHSTGHGETYWDKFTEIIKLGYIPVDIAKELGNLDNDWEIPDIKILDEFIGNGKYRLK